jgi:PAS domain S-box-containing protein
MMLPLERLWDARNRTPVLAVSAVIILMIAVVDWWTKPYVSLGFLYLFPIMLASAFLPRWVVALLGTVCAVLAEVFSSLGESFVRLSFETLALAGCGLFVGELVRNRRLSLEAQERLRALVETSPAAIVTVDEGGFIELANRAAVELMVPRDGHLIGNPIAAFLPELHHALRWEEAPQFRASMQCRGHRGNGESFTADVWFSTYKEGLTPKLAAIIADLTEEEVVESASETAVATSNSASVEHRGPPALNKRETGILRLLVQGLANKEIAARMEISESAVKNTIQQLFAKTGVRICRRLGTWSVRLRPCSSPWTFPLRSPITRTSLASNVWVRGRIRRSMPSWRATSTRFTSAAPSRPQPIRTNTGTNCSTRTYSSKMLTHFMPSTQPKA